jgi:hypothetical protein
MPQLDAGSTCPVTPLESGIDFRSYGVGRGIGDGPVYPAPFSPKATQPLNDYVVPTGWHGGKHVFLTLPSYRGPALIRGRQLDGAGVVTFASNEIPGAPSPAAPQPTLRIRAGLGSVARMFFFLTPPGCFAYQIDGTTFSKIVVFAVRISD